MADMIQDGLIDEIISQVESSAADNLKAKEDQAARLDAFSHTIKTLRKAAIEARAASGIETQWQDDEDFYEAVDSSIGPTTSRVKPYDFGGTGTGPTQLPQKLGNRSTVFVPMTGVYVDIAAARISDMYMPTDDRNWDGEPTPIPDLVKALEDKTPIADPNGQPVMQAPAPVMGQNQQPMVDANGQPLTQAAPVTVADKAQEVMTAATTAWEKGRAQIDDWLKECGYNGELRKAVHDMARIGVCVMKGPFPKSKISKAVRKTPEGFVLEIEEKVVPTSKRVDPWRFFPHAACGEDINTGSHLFEQDFITRSKLRDLRNPELNYLADQIDECLEEGPISATTGTKKSQTNEHNEADLFEIWYFEGQVEWQDMQDAGCECSGKKGDVFHALVTMVNDRIVKASLHHLDSGEFGYNVAVWKRKAGLWIGDGVGRQGRTAQQGLNAAVRNLMDNAGQSSRPHKVYNNSIKPGADPWTWKWSGDADIQDVTHAMMFFSVPSMQKELMEIIAYFQKMFEDATSLPMLLMGQQGAAPETVGGMEMLLNNAGTIPRNIVRMLDNQITEPHIKRYYEYLLIHGEDESAKGDFNIHARGSSALVERDAQSQFLINIYNMVMNPASEMDPKLYIEELLRSKRINPERLKLTDERKKELASRQPVEDPRVTAAKIMAQGGVQRVQAQGQTELQRIAQESANEQNMLQSGAATPHMAQATSVIERERIRAESLQSIQASRADTELARMTKEQEIAQQNGQFKLQEMSLQRDLAVLQYAHENQQTLTQVKSDLAQTSMKEQTRRELASAEIQLAVSEGQQNRVVDLNKHATTLQSDQVEKAKDRGLDLHKHTHPTPSLVRDEVSTPNTP